MNLSEAAAILERYGHLREGESIEDGIVSFQWFFEEELDEGCRKVHNRSLDVDGHIGPVTEELLKRPRCGCPDIQRAVEPEEANWPPACRTNLTTWLATDRLNLPVDTIKERQRAALDSWEAVIDVAFAQAESRGEARIWSTNGPLSGSTLAWSYLATGSCRSRLEQRYNTRTNWSPQLFQAVVAHEVGHALGMPHHRDRSGLMYPYARAGIYKPAAVDVRQAKGLGYGDPINKPEPEPPSEPPELPPELPPGWIVKGIEVDPIDGILTVHFSNGQQVNYPLAPRTS